MNTIITEENTIVRKKKKKLKVHKSKNTIKSKTALRGVVINNKMIIWYVNIIKQEVANRKNISLFVLKNRPCKKFII